MKALVFDLDGTLVDTKYDMLDAGNLVFENQGWTTSPVITTGYLSLFHNYNRWVLS